MPLVNGRQIVIPRFQEDEPLSALKLNAICDSLSKILNGSGLNNQVDNDPIAPIVQQFKLVGFASYYLLCHYWDGTNEGTDSIYVALPNKLRPSTWDGKTISGITYASTGLQTLTATRTSDSAVENWQIVLPYVINDIFYAVSNIRGGSGVVDGLGNAIRWVDMNTDARAWAKV